MSFLKELPDKSDIGPVFKFSHPDLIRHLLQLHQVVLREDSPLAVVERETLAAFTCGLLEAEYASFAHSNVAQALGLHESIIPALLEDIDSSDVEEKMKPIFRFVKKLTQNPREIEKEDIDSIYAAGWDGEAINHAVVICGLYNFMGRFTLGHGIELHAENVDNDKAHAAFLADHGYLKDLESLGL